MTPLWVILGTISQACLAMLVFMIVAFSAGGIANGSSLNSIQMGVLNLSLFILPGLCVISGGIVIYQYYNGGDASSYWWYAMPVLATVVYLIYAASLNKA